MDILEESGVYISEADELNDYDVNQSCIKLCDYNSKKIVYISRGNLIKQISFKSNNEVIRVIAKIIILGVNSDWFNSLDKFTIYSYMDILKKFSEWCSQERTELEKFNKYHILKVYEEHILNTGMKSSPLYIINSFLRRGLNSKYTSLQERNYVNSLLSFSIPLPNKNVNPVTLSDWFNIPWIRKDLGDNKFLQLESAKILMRSFKVTISATLIALLDARKVILSDYKEIESYREKSNKEWSAYLCRKHLRIDSKGKHATIASKILWMDLVKDNISKEFLRVILKDGVDNISGSKKMSDLNPPWIKPLVFSRNEVHQYSVLEELLCAWLLASEAIQPSAISKLRVTNFYRERGSSGRIVAMSCRYYKGRSGRLKETEILSGHDIWTCAIDKYIDGLSNENLFNRKIEQQLLFSPKTNITSRNQPVKLLYRIWSDGEFKESLFKEFDRAKSSSLFYESMMLFYDADITNKLPIKKLAHDCGDGSRPIHQALFSLQSVKTSAVHARSDKYRMNDLINYNSHTSLTEMTMYMTDKNKEWVNQSGRITRMVINHLQRVVYKPSIDRIANEVNNLNVRTKITDEGGGNLDAFGGGLFEDSYEIVVPDTIDTALIFIHYINQAEKYFDKLLLVKPDFVEAELIVKVEWINGILSKMKFSSKAQEYYKKLHPSLPNIFDTLINV